MERRHEPERLYLVIIRADAGPLEGGMIRHIMEKYRRIPNAEAELAFSSPKGDVLGLYVRAARGPQAIGAMADEHYVARDNGFTLVLELGERFAGSGNSSGWRHLQKLQPRRSQDGTS